MLTAVKAYAQDDSRFQVVEPLSPGDLVYSESGSIPCHVITFFGSDPCHVGIYIGDGSVIEAGYSLLNPLHAVTTTTLSEFESRGTYPVGFRGSKTTLITPTSAQRSQIVAYAQTKAARITDYDLDPAGYGYEPPCGLLSVSFGVSSCYDAFDDYNVFDCVGLAERAYESAGLDPTPAEEGGDFLYPTDQYFSSQTTYPSTAISTDAGFSTTVKSKFWSYFAINVPAGKSFLRVTTNGSDNIDLYIEKNDFPTLSSYACASKSTTGNETCQISNPSAGVYGIGIYGYDNNTATLGSKTLGFSLLASYEPNRISVQATLDGSPIVGPILANFTIDSLDGLTHLTGTSLPNSFVDGQPTPVLPGAYTLTYKTGGPNSSSVTVLPSAQQILCSNGNSCQISFTIAFTSNGSLSTNPDSVLSFGNVGTNMTSIKTVTIQNNGSASFHVNSVQLNGTGAFLLVSPPSTPAVVFPGSSLLITIKFAPNAPTTYAATLAIGNDATNAGPTRNVTLNGAGVLTVSAPAAPGLIGPGAASAPGQLISSATPVFSWTESSNAAYYNVYVSEPPYGDAHLVYTSPNISSGLTNFQIPSGHLQVGVAYRWNMSATNSVGTAFALPPIYFEITNGAVSPTITGVSPTNLVAASNSQTITLTGMNLSSAASVTFNVPTGAIQIYLSNQFLNQSATSISVSTPLNVSGPWSVVASTSTNQSSNTFPFQVTAAPQKPGTFQLTASPPTCNPPSILPIVGIGWTASAQANSYDIYRNSYPVATIQSNVLSWTDPANLSAGASYSYYVIASNAQGTTLSNAVSVNIPANVCYLQPAGNIVLGINGGGFAPAFTQGQSPSSIGLPINDDSGKPMLGSVTASTQSGGNWLSLNGQIGWTSPATLTVTFIPTGLAPGVYNGSLILSSPQASNSPLIVPVVMTISAPLVITTSPNLPDAFAGQPYSVTLQASGGIGLTWKIEDGTLPSGLSLNSSTGVISGTTGAIYGTSPESLNISVRDSAGRYVWQAFTINWRQGITVGTTGPTTWVVGTPVQNFAFSLAASGGREPYQWSATGLPAGVVLSPSGALTGAPTSAANLSVTFTAADSIGLTGSLTIPIKVIQIPLQIYGPPTGGTSPSMTSGVAGTAYSQAYFYASGGTQNAYQWTVSGTLPSGMTATQGGGCNQCSLIVSGTPTTAGVYPLTVQVTDSAANTLSAFVVLVINNPGNAPKITAATLPLSTIGQSYQFAFAATGGTGPLTWTINGPISDSTVALSTGGVLTANPNVPNDCQTGPGIYLPPQYAPSRVFFVQVTDAVGQTDVIQSCLPAYYSQPEIRALSPSGAVPNGSSVTITLQGQNFLPGSQIQFSNTAQPTTYVSPTVLQFSLLPAKYDEFQMPNGAQLQAYNNWPINVLSPYTYRSNTLPFGIYLPKPTITSVQNHLYNSTRLCIPNLNCQLVLTGTGFTSETQFQVIGNSQYIDYLDTTSTVAPWTQVTTSSFYVTTPGIYTIQVTNPNQPDGSSATATATFDIVSNFAIVPIPASFNPKFTQGDSGSTASLYIAPSPDGITGTAVASTQSGGNWLKVNSQLSVNWTTPQTLTLSFDPSGLAPATYNGSITLTGPQSPNSPLVVPVAMLVSTPLKITTSSSLPDAYGGQAYNTALQATGGVGLIWTIKNGSLPAGLILNPLTGVIGGTVGSIGSTATQSITVSVEDSLNRSVSQTVAITWKPGIVILPPNSGLTTLVVGTLIPNTSDYSFNASGGTTPYQWSTTGLPAGITLSTSGQLGGTPTAKGNYSVVISVTDSIALKSALSIPLLISQLPLKIVDNSFGNSPPVAPSGTLGIQYQAFFIGGSGGSQNGYQWATNGGLPPGINAGPPANCSLPGCALRFSGTPSKAGTYPVTIVLSDSAGNSSTNDLIFVISEAELVKKVRGQITSQ